MLELTEEKLEKLLAENEHVLYTCGDWFPTLQEIKAFIEPHMDSVPVVRFALWVLETSTPPSSSADKEARRYLMDLVYSHIVYPEEEDDMAENTPHK